MRMNPECARFVPSSVSQHMSSRCSLLRANFSSASRSSKNAIVPSVSGHS